MIRALGFSLTRFAIYIAQTLTLRLFVEVVERLIQELVAAIG